MELSIDTSTRYASVALSKKGQVTHALSWRSEQNHSVECVPAMRRIMEQAGVSPADIEAVFVAKGPGGFSALRVGVSVAKAMSMAQGIPLVAVGSLHVEAYPYLGLGRPVCAVMTAGKKTLYAGRFEQDASPYEDGAHQVAAPEDVAAASPEGTLFCGESLPLLAERGLPRGAATANCTPPTRLPSALTAIAYRRLCESDIDDTESLQPTYIRGSQLDSARRGVRMLNS